MREENNNVDGIVTGNYFNKFESKNPLVRFVMNKYHQELEKSIGRMRVSRLLEVGCGEGNIINFMIKKYKPSYIKGLDIDEKMLRNLSKKYPQFDFKKQFLDEKFQDEQEYDLVLCLEVLEHIEKYNAALNNIKKIKSKKIVFSVPNEPFFRIANVARLHYVKQLGNTPGHVNNFTYFDIYRVIKKHFPKDKVTISNCYIWNFVVVERK